jgi:hypothetical protein
VPSQFPVFPAPPGATIAYRASPLERIVNVHWGGIGAVYFDGATWLSKTPLPPELTDSGTGIFSVWVKPDDLSFVPYLFSVGPFDQFGIGLNTDGTVLGPIGYVGYEYDDSGTTLLNQRYSYNVPGIPPRLQIGTAQYWHLLLAWKTTGAVVETQVTVNGVYAGTLTQDYSATPNYDAAYPPVIDYLGNRRKDFDGTILAGPNTELLALSLTAGGDAYKGDVAELYFAPGQYLDISVAENIAKFINTIDSPSRPVDLGAGGITPTGTKPLVLLHVGPVTDNAGAATFANNTAAAVPWSFAVTGAILPPHTMPVQLPLPPRSTRA